MKTRVDIDTADQPTRARPTLTELAELIRKVTSMGLRVGVPGRVTAYNATTQIASVQVEILTVRPDPITGLDLPKPPLVIPNVPVVFPSNGAGAAYTFPIVPGTTTGELRFMDRAIGRWLTTGVPSDPGKPGAHKFEDAIFTPGLHSLTQPLAQAADTGTVIDDATTVKIGGSAAVEPMIKATTFIALMDAMIAAALVAATTPDGGKLAFGAFQTTWNNAKTTINATKGRVF